MDLGLNRGLETNYHEALQGLPQYRPRQIMKQIAQQTFNLQPSGSNFGLPRMSFIVIFLSPFRYLKEGHDRRFRNYFQYIQNCINRVMLCSAVQHEVTG